MEQTFLVERSFSDFPSVIPDDFAENIARYLNNHYENNRAYYEYNKTKYMINDLDWDFIKHAARSFLNGIPLNGNFDSILINDSGANHDEYAVKFVWTRLENIRANITNDIELLSLPQVEGLGGTSTRKHKYNRKPTSPFEKFKISLKHEIADLGIIDKINGQLFIVFVASSGGVRLSLFEINKKGLKNMKPHENRIRTSETNDMSDETDVRIDNALDSSLGTANVRFSDNLFTIRLFSSRVGETVFLTAPQSSDRDEITVEEIEEIKEIDSGGKNKEQETGTIPLKFMIPIGIATLAFCSWWFNIC